jgi:hypothetical protein
MPIRGPSRKAINTLLQGHFIENISKVPGAAGSNPALSVRVPPFLNLWLLAATSFAITYKFFNGHPHLPRHNEKYVMPIRGSSRNPIQSRLQGHAVEKLPKFQVLLFQIPALNVEENDLFFFGSWLLRVLLSPIKNL